jgi:3-oxoacyl-(acyl-carrier-protein) synthase
MNARIAGYGWITSLGADADLVWQRLRQGDPPEIKTCANPESGALHRFIPIPPKLVESLARNPRLRRASAISYFACAAGLAALARAGVEMSAETAARTALVFAITDGGVVYTRKFYEQIVKAGANSASPLLFPETVYNAPASHLAAQLGIDGASYTLVGDGAVGMSALHFGAQLLATTDIDRCVVVGAEECDWILCEAYNQWRLARTPLAEGAAAVVLARSGLAEISTDPGETFSKRKDASAALATVFSRLKDSHAASESADLAVISANGSFIDSAEQAAIQRSFPGISAISPKRAFGETLGAGALMQLIVALLALEKEQRRNVVVSVIGFNHHAGAAIVRASPSA